MTPDDAHFDVIVIGGGHAGAEAAWAAANLLRDVFVESREATGGGRVALITMDPTKIGAMSCNPAIGGLAKGQMVREIDALGGLMAHAADDTGIQFRILNASKGPAVHGPRAQCDKYAYARQVQRLLGTRPNLTIISGTVDAIHVMEGKVQGVTVRGSAFGVHGSDNPKSPITNHKYALRSHAIVLTTGTFMRGLMHTGDRKTEGGRVGEGSAVGISAALGELGLELGRLKTGTPPRLAAESIDFASLPVQPGDDPPIPFSLMPNPRFPILPQRVCWITQTSPAIHDAIRANLDRAPLFNGQIETVGPRYCPSIEDKIHRFADRASHHVFLEPESLETNEIYCNGISTSLPGDVQELVVHGLPGCEHARILRYGYAVEYDMVLPHQIDATGMTKRIAGLFLAGQINGTSGYEEAAAQGLLAGLNAVRFLRREDLVRFGRDIAYLGVLMDDLVTKTPREPYRMFTSRAEFRLLLRSDNADQRLTPLGREFGLVDDERWAHYQSQERARATLRDYLSTHQVDGERFTQWIRKPDVDATQVLAALNGDSLPAAARGPAVLAAVLADFQYEGYITRQRKEADRLASQEHAEIPGNFDFSAVLGLRREASITLDHFRPATLGQAGRLAGVTPADLMLVSVALQRATRPSRT
jgi:tRNA uridine 5-carboxymethylaminomethyl modification enzyme